MAVLTTLKKDGLGEWRTLAEYLADLRRRETNSVAALALALSAAAGERRELAEGAGLAVLVEVASDLRLPKGSRLAAARCAVEAGATGEALATLFAGAGDLVTDPRLGAAARKLVESGLPAALALRAPAEVSLEAGRLARAAQAGASAVGKARIEELLAAAPRGHAGAAAALFALGAAELPPGDRERWAKLLEKTCAANRAAPAAAKRVGLAPAWPPNLPDAFAPLIAEAERAAAHVTAADAAAAPARSDAAATRRAAGRLGAPLPSEPGPAAASAFRGKPPPAEPRTPRSTGPLELGKKVVAPIRASPFRRPLGTVVEGPIKLPPKPMPPVAGRATAPVAEQQRAPVLPAAPQPRPMRRAAAAAGPFARRFQALFDDRPEAVERLCAAVEARAAVHGLATALDELARELSLPRWSGRRAPAGQLERLGAVAKAQPEPWSAAAVLLLGRMRERD
jgi:hypothetical protein